MARENPAPGEEGPTDVLSPFPAWQPAAPEETPVDESQAPRATLAASRGMRLSMSAASQADESQAPRPPPAKSRGLRSPVSAASSAQSLATPPPQQPRPKRFNLRDGAREAIKTMREGAEAKLMVVAEPLYGFYNTEINLHFLHALSAYFIRVAKDISLERRRQRQPRPPQTRAAEREEEGRLDGDKERSALLREVGRSYGRVIVYCSNFERTTADALFFESLLCLARIVVATAVAEPSLAPEMDMEFDRILRGGVFHPTPIIPAPRPPMRPRRKPLRKSPRDDPRRSFGSRPTPANGLDSTNGDSDGGGRNPGNRRGVLDAGGSVFAPPGSMRGGDARGFPSDGGGKKRRGRPGEPGRHTGPAVEPGSSKGSAVRASSAAAPTRPSSSRQHAGGGSGVATGATSTPPRTSSRRGRGGPSVSSGFHEADGGTHDAQVAGRGGRKQRLRGGSPGEKPIPEGKQDGAAAPFPAFDELSRWKVTRGSVPRMVRLAGEAQRVALSNLALAEGYRCAMAAELQKKMSSALPTTTNTNTNPTATSIVHQTVTPSRPDASSLSPTATTGKKPPFWKRRGRALTPRKKRSGGVRPAADSSSNGKKEYFCAKALSVCIGSIVGS